MRSQKNKTQLFFTSTLLSFVLFSALLYPAETRAQTGTVWGGMIIYTMPCTCVPTVTWVLVMNPITGGAFDYVTGTQMYRERTMPLAQYGLGNYWSSGPACWMGVTPYCYLISSYGMISSVTGSSI